MVLYLGRKRHNINTSVVEPIINKIDNNLLKLVVKTGYLEKKLNTIEKKLDDLYGRVEKLQLQLEKLVKLTAELKQKQEKSIWSRIKAWFSR